MKILFLESVAGIAGDMFAAAFVDAGLVTVEEFQSLCGKLQLSKDVSITATAVLRSAIKATQIKIAYDPNQWLTRFAGNHSQHPHIHFRDLEQFILHSTLSDPVKTLACRFLHTLAEAEARCHLVSKNEVAFHELGMLDSLLDIVLCAYCIASVKPDKIIATPIKLSRGYVCTAHGTQPIPTPVCAELVSGMPVAMLPDVVSDENIELSTPTGLALLKTLTPVFSAEWPAGKVMVSGRGAGSMSLESYPNLFRVSLIEGNKPNRALPYEQDEVIEIKVNYDDETAEKLAWTAQKLLELGALDVWQTPATGKKGRMLIVLSILIKKDLFVNCVDFILRKTSTFGLRCSKMERWKLSRYFESREIDQTTCQVKIGCNTNAVKLKEKVEFEDIQKTWLAQSGDDQDNNCAKDDA